MRVRAAVAHEAGKAAVEAFLRMGARVAVNRSGESPVAKVLAELKAGGGRRRRIIAFMRSTDRAPLPRSTAAWNAEHPALRSRGG